MNTHPRLTADEIVRSHFRRKRERKLVMTVWIIWALFALAGFILLYGLR